MKLLKTVWKQLWLTTVVALVLLALYSSLGRQLVPLLETYQADIEQQLSQMLGQPVRIGRLSGSWTGLSPVIHIDDLQIAGLSGINIDKVDAELLVSASLLYRSPIFKRIRISGAHSQITQISERQWQLAPGWQITLPEKDTTATSSDEVPAWLLWLTRQRKLELKDINLSVSRLAQTADRISIRQITWHSNGQQHSLNGDLAVGKTKLADLQLDAYLDGELWSWQQQHGRIFLKFGEQDWAQWLPHEIGQHLQIEQLRGSTEGWLTVEQGNLAALYLTTQISQLELVREQQSFKLQGKIQIAGEHSGHDWHVRLQPEFAEPLPFQGLGLSQVHIDQQSVWQLQIDQLDLGKTQALLERYRILPEKVAHYIEGVAPQGEGQQIRLTVFRDTQQHWQADVRAEIKKLASQAYHGIPAFADVDASLHLQPLAGLVTFNDDKLQVHLADLYDPTWHVEQAQGRFRWLIQPDHAELLLERTQLRLKEQNNAQSWPVYADMKIVLPLTDSAVEPNIGLLLGIPEGPASLHQQLVPNLVGLELQHWLNQGILAGQAQQASFALHTVLSSTHPLNSTTSQLSLGFEQAQVSYLEGWPKANELGGQLLLDVPNLDIRLTQGRSLGGHIKPNISQIKLRHNGEHPELEVALQIDGKTQEGLRYFTDTPLVEVVGHAFDAWRANGNHQTDFLMRLELGAEKVEPKIWLKSTLKNNQLRLTNLGLTLDALQGELNYNTAQGVFSPQLQANIFGGPLNVKLDSLYLPSGQLQVGLSGQGEAHWEALKKMQPIPWLTPITGQFAYQLGLQVGGEQGQLQLDTDLVGTHINFPEPLAKLPEQVQPLHVKLKLGEQTEIFGQFRDISTRLLLAGAELERGQIQIGAGEAKLPPDAGLLITGQIYEQVNLEPWWQTLKPLIQISQDAQQATHTVAPSQTELPIRIKLDLDDLNAWGMVVQDSRIEAQQQKDKWLIQMDSSLLKGDMVFTTLDQPLQLNLDYVHLPSSVPDDDENAPPAPAVDPLASIDPTLLPPFNLTLSEFFIGGRNFGQWQLQARPLEQGVLINIEKGDLYGMELQGGLRWMQSDTGQHTYLDQISFSSNDVGKIQRGFRLTPVLEGKKLSGTVNWNWAGSPAAFALEHIQGEVDVQIRNGQLVTESNTAALKAVGALNIGSLSRRLKLDFSDLYQSGVAFDKLSTKLLFDQGALTTIEPIRIDGPSGKFNISGTTHLVTRQLDMEVAVNLPITNNLPIVAILAGLAPPVAASIYVTEKLVGDEISRFTTAKYDLKGSWQEPDMTLRSAFSKGESSKRSFKERVLGIFKI